MEEEFNRYIWSIETFIINIAKIKHAFYLTDTFGVLKQGVKMINIVPILHLTDTFGVLKLFLRIFMIMRDKKFNRYIWSIETERL